MATSSISPQRPSLHRAHFTTNSLPQHQMDYPHERPLARSIPGFNPTNALSPPYQQTRKGSFGQEMQPRKASFGNDMLRTESADSHRSLKSKHSRKELKEMARSGSPLVTTFQAASTKHKYTRSWEDDGNDDDARSISSFTCSFADEFDTKHKTRLEYGNEEASNRQRFLDAVFRKLTQKTGVHKRESRAWAAVEQTIREEQISSEQAMQSKASKVKAHFLDLSNYISPIPVNNTADSNVTPRQADVQRFKGLSPDDSSLPSKQQRPTLRARRSAETLGETRRLQREEWSMPQGAATTDNVPSRAIGMGQTAPTGMSHALMAREHSSSSASPVPVLPAWARSNNLSLHHQQRSADFNRPYDSLQPPYRAVDMGRAASHDTGSLMQRATSRPPVVARGVSGPVRMHSSDQQQQHPLLPLLHFRGQGRAARSIASPMTPISPQWPRSAHTLPDDCISPTSNKSSNMLHRSSVSSAASDSASSGISSVPQTPISRKIALPSSYSNDDEIEMTVDEEENLLSAMGQYALENGKTNALGVDRFARMPHSTTPRQFSKRAPHVATLFDSTIGTPHRPSHYKSSSSGSVTSSIPEEKESNATVKANRIMTRPRASTTSSVQSSPTRFKASPEALAALPSASPESPSRSSSLQSKKSARGAASRANPSHRESTLSSHSTTSATTSTSSHSESLLSYTRGSPTSSCPFPAGTPPAEATPSSRSRLAPSQRKRTTSRAEDWASSIGRRFAKGINANASNPQVPTMPNTATDYKSTSFET
jgi:hypothetical protein